jgi:hypothetical protein
VRLDEVMSRGVHIAAGRAAVPNTCCVNRSRSRNGSVRINMVTTSNCPFISNQLAFEENLDSFWQRPQCRIAGVGQG